jgi:hypothetical protein
VTLVVGAGIVTAGTASAVSVAPVGRSSVIAAEGPGHTLVFYWQTIGAKPWNREIVAAGGTTLG